MSIPEIPQAPSVSPREAEKFGALADHWWAEDGPMRPLHRLNPLRIGFLRDEICRRLGRDPDLRRPLIGLSILDIGCGGGLLSEPLARLGADVTGLDAAPEGIAAASAHAEMMGLAIHYETGAIEHFSDTHIDAFDVVLAMEVLEHVESLPDFYAAAARALGPGGLLFAATINRTLRARALAIGLAEYVLRWLPAGTHEFDKFIRPEELAGGLEAVGLRVHPPIGVTWQPLADRFVLTPDCSVNYMLGAEKTGPGNG